MDGVLDSLLYRISDEACEMLASGADSRTKFISDIDLLENLFSKVSGVAESRKQVIIKEAEEEVESLTKSVQKVDTSSVLERASDARKIRLERLEHETMAKLVNMMRSREELSVVEKCLGDSIAGMESEAGRLDGELERRRSAIRRLQELIPSVQEALERDIAECG